MHEYEIEKLKKEAYAIGRYFSRKGIAPELADRYIKFHEFNTVVLSKKENRLMNLCIKHPAFLPFADSGMRMINNNAPFMRKLLCMAAIIEASTGYYKYFFPDRLSFLKAGLLVFSRGLLALFKIITGYVFLRLYLIR